MSWIDEAERAKAREVSMYSVKRDGARLLFPTTRPDELMFDLGEDPWVEGTTPFGQRVRIPLAEVDRFDLEHSEREGDDKTHHYYWMLIAAGTRVLIYKERQPEYVYNPIPGLTRKEIVELNLGALVTLLDSRVASLRSEFGAGDPALGFVEEGSAYGSKSSAAPARPVSNAEMLGCGAGTLLVVWWAFRRIFK